MKNISMPLEGWVSLSSLGLSIMFSLLIVSFYNVLIGPDGKGPDRFVEIDGVLIKNVSISGAPSLILAGVVFGLTRSYGSKLSGMFLILSGIVMIIGSITAHNMISEIPQDFFSDGLVIVTYIFLVGGIGILIIGILLFKKVQRVQR